MSGAFLAEAVKPSVTGSPHKNQSQSVTVTFFEIFMNAYKCATLLDISVGDLKLQLFV